MRYHVYSDARYIDGEVAAGQTLTVYTDSGAGTAATLYTTESGAVEAANPYTVPATGIVDFWTPSQFPYALAEDDTEARALQVGPGRSVLFDVRSYGATGDGTTDDSTAVIAALAAADAAGGGVVYFPAGTYRIDSQLAMPSEAASGGGLRQNPITLRGDGAKVCGLSDTLANAIGGTVLDLRYVGAGGKINSTGWGTLNIEDLHLTQAASATDATVFLYNTRTITRINRVTVSGHSTLSGVTCIQDAFQFGGVTDETMFQGYTSEVCNVVFDRIRSGFVIREAGNAIFAQNVGWTISCGSDGDHGAIDIDGTGDTAISGVYVNMTTEGDYPYRIRLKNATSNHFISPGFWDDNATLVACVKLEGTSTGNVFTEVWTGVVQSKWWVKENAADRLYWSQGGYSYGGQQYITGGIDLAGAGQTMLTIIPQFAPADGADHRMLSVRRSLVEETNPNGEVASIRYDGSIECKDITTSGPGLGVSGLVAATGNLALFAGTGATDRVIVERGTLDISSYTTAGRPAANIGAGCVYYDTTLSKPVFSDGSKWRDAAGTEV